MIWCPQGHKHWHGATQTTSMTHIAIQEALDGKKVEWLEKVTDEQSWQVRLPPARVELTGDGRD